MDNKKYTHPPHRFVALYKTAAMLRDELAKKEDVDGGHVDAFPETLSEADKVLEVDRPVTWELYSQLLDIGKNKYIAKTCYTYRYYSSEGDTVLATYQYSEPQDQSRPKEMKKLPVIERILEVTTKYQSNYRPDQGELERAEPKQTVTKLSIHSPMVLDALRAIVTYYPGSSLDDQSLLMIEHPYWMPSHHRSQLLAYKNQHPSTHSQEYIDECNTHIDEVVRCLDQEHHDVFNQVRERLEQKDPVITYDTLWLLFRPGETIYARDGAHLDPFIVEELDYHEGMNQDFSKKREFTIAAWNIDSDGKDFGRSKRVFLLTFFKGEQKVSSLKCFPTRFHVDLEGEVPLRERLILRGKTFLEISKKPSYMEYTGLTIDAPRRKVGCSWLLHHVAK